MCVGSAALAVAGGRPEGGAGRHAGRAGERAGAGGQVGAGRAALALRALAAPRAGHPLRGGAVLRQQRGESLKGRSLSLQDDSIRYRFLKPAIRLFPILQNSPRYDTILDIFYIISINIISIK